MYCESIANQVWLANKIACDEVQIDKGQFRSRRRVVFLIFEIPT